MPRVIGQKAVIVGAGIAGLTAARALADSFDEVAVLERDTVSAEPLPRTGVPQGRHPHALLVGGQRALTVLFPNFEGQLLSCGGLAVNSAAARWEIGGYNPFPQRDFGFTA